MSLTPETPATHSKRANGSSSVHSHRTSLSFVPIESSESKAKSTTSMQPLDSEDHPSKTTTTNKRHQRQKSQSTTVNKELETSRVIKQQKSARRPSQAVLRPQRRIVYYAQQSARETNNSKFFNALDALASVSLRSFTVLTLLPYLIAHIKA
jgi:hypothetical protein